MQDTPLGRRRRLLRSMILEVAEKGYDGVTIADVVARASVSRTTFYDEFANKDDCLFAAYESVIQSSFRRVERAFTEEGAWPERVRRGLEVLVNDLANAPDVARMTTVEVPAAGPEAYRRYREATESFAPFLRQGRDHVGRGSELPANVEFMAVGGAEAIIFDEVVDGRASRLAQLLPEILFAVLCPYLGPEEASQEMRKGTSP